MRASSSDYDGQDKSRARVIQSWDGYSLYLLIVDEASRFLWVFLTKSKEPPHDIAETFLGRFGHADGGVVRTDQGGELARSSEFCDTILHNYQYVIEPTGADSPSQNGAAEIYNGKLAVRARTLIFCSGLPAKFWSSAMLHAVYLHNWLVHTVTRTTPFKLMFGIKPDLSALKIFGSRVCVKRSGKQRSKLDRHDLRESSSGIQPLIRTLSTSTWTQGLSKRVIMLSSMRHGISNQPACRLLSYCMTLGCGLRRRQYSQR
jgi:hypothetical protein